MCVGEMVCHFMCTIRTHYLKRLRAFTPMRSSSTFMCHIFFEEYQTLTQYTSCSTEYIQCGTHIFVSDLLCAGRVAFYRLPFSPNFPAGCFHLTPPPPRNAILCVYVCNLKRLTKMDISRIKESNIAVTATTTAAATATAVSKRGSTLSKQQNV